MTQFADDDDVLQFEIVQQILEIRGIEWKILHADTDTHRARFYLLFLQFRINRMSVCMLFEIYSKYDNFQKRMRV
jgi:hypothetical protein